MIRAASNRPGKSFPWLQKPQKPMASIPWYAQRVQPAHGAFVPDSRLDRNPAEDYEDQKVMHRRKKRRGH